jgi:tRNA pseudouridine55 synthase
MNGILVVDKPSGLSSHAVVTTVRRLTGEKRVGHAGTLDPLATGVLVLLLGSAVRLSEYLIEHDKKYLASARLGIETDTYDATGQVVALQEVTVSPEAVRDTLNSFLGTIDQVPPAHSAVQSGGVRAYKLARKGIAVDIPPRKVQVYSIDVETLTPDTVVFRVHCSKGTYIRSLVHDLGARLGTGAHLSALRRLASGEFTLADSVSLTALQSLSRGEVEQLLIPADRGLSHLASVHLDSASARAARHGQSIPAPADLTAPLVRAYDERGSLFAILEQAHGGRLKPKKVLDVDSQ